MISNEELDDPYVCMTGKELVEACTLEERMHKSLAIERLNQRKERVVKSLQILACTSPYYNKFLITLLKENNRVVAATGSKSEDLEIFDICDVALSFGKMGSDITKS